jgi:hypothetical protein
VGNVTQDPYLVVHLTNEPMHPGSIDRRLMAWGLLVGLITVAAGFMRVIAGGQSQAGLMTAAVVGVIVLCLLFLYAWLRRRNATLYVRGDRLGVTNWLGIRQELPISIVDYMQIVPSTPKVPVPPRILLIVAKDPRRTIQFSGGDRLEAGGIERVSSLSGVQLKPS